jgi:hypothetical protein
MLDRIDITPVLAVVEACDAQRVCTTGHRLSASNTCALDCVVQALRTGHRDTDAELLDLVLDAGFAVRGDTDAQLPDDHVAKILRVLPRCNGVSVYVDHPVKPALGGGRYLVQRYVHHVWSEAPEGRVVRLLWTDGDLSSPTSGHYRLITSVTTDDASLSLALAIGLRATDERERSEAARAVTAQVAADAAFARRLLLRSR